MTLDRTALTLAAEAHAGQVDKAGAPYIDHVTTVAAAFDEDSLEHLVALLHDIVEDTAITLVHLKAAGLPEEIVAAVDAITKRKSESYNTYLARVKANHLARVVKIRDLEHNSDLSRLSSVTEKDTAQVAKYRVALEYLRQQ